MPAQVLMQRAIAPNSVVLGVALVGILGNVPASSRASPFTPMGCIGLREGLCAVRASDRSPDHCLYLKVSQ
jgi:hypothetical protein